MLLLDVIDNMPHLRLSNDHMRTILWMLKELNVPETPSFYALRETQKKLADEMGIQPHEHISALGNNFHAVAPEDLLALVSYFFLLNLNGLLTACRTGPIHTYGNQCICTQRLLHRLASHGKPGNGAMKSLSKS